MFDANDSNLTEPIFLIDTGCVELFTANIHNPLARRAYARACGPFFAWREDRGLTITVIRSLDVAAWVEELGEKHRGAAEMKQ